MFCQKCRTPLTLDGSLENLGPAAFNLLTDSATKRVLKDNSSSRPLYTEQQKSLYDQVRSTAGSPTLKRVITPGRHGVPYEDGKQGARQSPGHPAMSYVLLTESQVGPSKIPTPPASPSPRARHRRSNSSLHDSDDTSNLLSDKVETTARLFSVLSSPSDIDHPICTECTALLMSGLEKRLAFATKERDAYVSFLRTASVDNPTPAERKEATSQLASLQDQERAAFRELEDLESEHDGLLAELATLTTESDALEAEEIAFFRAHNAFAADVAAAAEERDSLTLRLAHDAHVLERLQRTNVYHDAFHITHDGHFGTINGLRLGRLPGKNVEWAEINAAWGQTCFLLVVVAEKVGFEFTGWRLKPMGSVSAVERIESKASSSNPTSSGRLQGSKSTTTTGGSPPEEVKVLETLPLHYSSDLPIALAFWNRHFDTAMIAFLDCVKQLGAHVERTTAEEAQTKAQAQAGGAASGTGARGRSGGLRLPYSIRGDVINDVSIKLGGDANWTRACKSVLTCLKLLLAYASTAGERQ